LADGRVDPTLPWISRESLRLLAEEYPDAATARQRIADELAAFYRADHPAVAAERGEDVTRSATALAEVWGRNVFPAMGVTWGSYPNHIGHENTPGCFRCHDEEHATPEGETISQDCSTCHTLLAMEEEDPAILRELQP
jgi:hypothetical protein